MNCPTGALKEPTEADVRKVSDSIYPKLRKILMISMAVFYFMCNLAAFTGVNYELRKDRMVIFKPAAQAEVAIHLFTVKMMIAYPRRVQLHGEWP